MPVAVKLGAAGGATLTRIVADPTVTTPPVGTRDPLKQPFASTSIWNMPIGADARYVHAGMLGNPLNDAWMDRPRSDPMRIAMTPTAPLTPIRFSDAEWGGNRCNATGTPSQYASNPVATVPMPAGWTVPSSGDNGCAAFLMPDKRTVIQVQPFARCVPGSFGTAAIKLPGFIGDANKDQDLYGSGALGAQGGSRLSALGGTLRLGELRPGQQGPKHALKIIIDSRNNLYNASAKADTYRWPAIASDSNALADYGATRSGPPCMKMGSLLALLPSVVIANLGLQTEPGRQFAWTLQNYGMYIVDDASGGLAIATEEGAHGSFMAQFQADWGFPFQQRHRDNLGWTNDLGKLLPLLHVVDNNSPTSIGGGGTPRQPLAPSIGPGP